MNVMIMILVYANDINLLMIMLDMIIVNVVVMMIIDIMVPIGAKKTETIMIMMTPSDKYSNYHNKE